jgi:hypothetical protein
MEWKETIDFCTHVQTTDYDKAASVLNHKVSSDLYWRWKNSNLFQRLVDYIDVTGFTSMETLQPITTNFDKCAKVIQCGINNVGTLLNGFEIKKQTSSEIVIYYKEIKSLITFNILTLNAK